MYLPETLVMNEIVANNSISVLHSYKHYLIAGDVSGNLTIWDTTDSMPESIIELYSPIVIPKSYIISYKAIRENHRICIEKDSVVIKEAEL